jgi:hypothetical protein
LIGRKTKVIVGLAKILPKAFSREKTNRVTEFWITHDLIDQKDFGISFFKNCAVGQADYRSSFHRQLESPIGPHTIIFVCSPIKEVDRQRQHPEQIVSKTCLWNGLGGIIGRM